MVAIILLIGITGCGSEEPPIKKSECVKHTINGVDFYVPNSLEYDDDLSIESAHVFTSDDYYASVGYQEDHFDISASDLEEIRKAIGKNADAKITEINGVDCVLVSCASDVNGDTINHRIAYFDVNGKTGQIVVSWKNGNYQKEFDAITNYSIGQ